MKFKINAKALLQGITPLFRIIPAKSVSLAGTCFLLEVKDGILTVTASDSDCTGRFRVALQDKESIEEGSVLVVAREMLDLTKLLPQDANVTVLADGNSASVDWGNGHASLIVVSDTLQTLEAGDGTPVFSTSFNEGQLLGAVNDTIGSVSDEELRPVLKGIYFDFSKEGTSLVATDSRQLVVHQMKDHKSELPCGFIIDGRPMAVIQAVMRDCGDPVALSIDKLNATFVFTSGYTFTARLTPGRFPKYGDVIPKDNDNVLEIGRTALIKTIKRMAVCSSAGLQGVLRFDFSALGGAIVSVEDLALATKARETLEDCTYTGTDIHVGFKAGMLTDILGALNCERVLLKMKGERNAALVVPAEEGAQFTGLAMPMYTK